MTWSYAIKFKINIIICYSNHQLIEYFNINKKIKFIARKYY